MQTHAIPTRRNLEFGVYRDGDNNLDASQTLAVTQALKTSAKDSTIEFTVQNTTGLRSVHGDIVEGKTRTDSFTIDDGTIGQANVSSAHDMADPKNLAQFVAHTLDNAQASGAKQTWIDLVDHGGGDGGGLETHDGSVMAMPAIAKAIADGISLHAKEHPEDAHRGVDGVVANQCLMSTLGFADALSRVGVKYLAASPETMVSPGTPTTVAHDISLHSNDPKAMAQSVVHEVMHTRYGANGATWGPAAAFDVLDTSRATMQGIDTGVKRLDDDLISASHADESTHQEIRRDVNSVDGMVRFPQSQGLPWHADRPAMAVYDVLAHDSSLSATIRQDAKDAERAVASSVLAHAEAAHFAPFGGSSYRNAVGPTAHLPTTRQQIDPWASRGISETKNAFYHGTDEDKLARSLA